MHKLTRLDNGLRVVTAEMPHARSASVAFFFGSGSRWEEKEISGSSHFIEHMLFKGTEQRPTAKDISEAIEGVGGVLNAESGKEVTVYWAKVTLPHLPLALEVITDVVRNSVFDHGEVEKERRVIIEELSMLMDAPQEWVDVLIDEVMWGDQPLGRDVGGTKESVGRITRDELLAFRNHYYRPGNLVVSVAGAINHDQVVEEVAKLLGSWEDSPVGACPPVETGQRGTRIRVEKRKTEQAHICLAVPGVSYLHPDRFALDLLNVVLGEGMSARLFQEVREKQGLAYDVHSYVNHYRDAGGAHVYAGVHPSKIEPAIEAILREIERVKYDIPEDDLSRSKEFWKGRMQLRLEDTRALASWMGGQELLLGRIMTVEEVVATVDSITVEDVQRVAKALFVSDRLNLALIAPRASEARLERLLKL